jgi:geranylgeranyl pyrophosphate synthase
MFCLVCQLLGRPTDEAVLRLSTSFELLHLATLFHDDIIDMSDTRRGKPAAHLAFGTPEAVLAADYLLAKAAEVVLDAKNIDCFSVFVRIIKELSLGELEQLKRRRQVNLTAQEYERVIYRKTAVLMEGVGQVAGWWVGGATEWIEDLGRFGSCLGKSFQVMDDILDYSGNPDQLGKPIGQDLDEGRITLPFIMALEYLKGEERERLLALGSQENLTEGEKKRILTLVAKSSGLERATRVAVLMSDQAILALSRFPESQAKEELTKLARSAVNRRK